MTVRSQVRGNLGLLTLDRPQALNALSLEMLRRLTESLLAWAQDPQVTAVVLRGAARDGKAPAFCAGGDLRFFHRAARAGDPALEDFFTEEYALDHLIDAYPKPMIALMDGVTLGGGMGIAQGARVRVVTEHSRLAMPETGIGLVPDAGGGWFLGRLPGACGEWLALTGHALGPADALALGLADVFVPSGLLPAVVEALADQPIESGAQALATVRARAQAVPGATLDRVSIDRHFSAPTLRAIAESLSADHGDWARDTLAALRRLSPLMMAVALEQVRRARTMTLADELRMERGLVRRAFHLRSPARSEAVEGIRALAIDKDRAPHWNPPHIEDVTPAMLAPFFDSPWPGFAHPLRML
jgi:enoyl-CoA hydratase